MANGIRIDELDATLLPSRDHVVPAMKDGLTVKLTVGQILDLLGKVLDPDEVGSKALFAALNLSDLDDPEQARANIAALSYESQSLDSSQQAQARANIGADNASNLSSGTVPNARISNTLTADKAFRRGNILGTVSQSGGTPTGAIIERSSNANGEYVRFADGTQICWNHALNPPASENTMSSGIVRSAASSQEYPAAFVGPAVNAYSVIGPSAEIGGIRNASSSGWSFRIFGFNGNSWASGDVGIAAVAIGRWF